ncbi:MAG: PHP domain-containing protein [Anaerolineales bacterium]|nr:PHP domain-containing protein [Anaerolineales bacterium]MCB8961796.1 PHP domain-containing protein [Ardenticatenales bacterium]
MPTSPSVLHLAATAAIDLQLHTTYSDGSWTPAALLDHLAQAQFGLAAITDHDSLQHIAPTQQLALTKAMPLLAAVEMTTRWRGEMVDLLCFGIDPAGPMLNNLIDDLLQRQQENTREVLANLAQQGFRFAEETQAAILVQPPCLQPHALVNLVNEHGGDPGGGPAGPLILRAGAAFMTHEPAAVVAATHQAGGVCLVAHPGRTDGYLTFDSKLLAEFGHETAVDGLEVYYPRHTPAQTAEYQAFAERHQLLVSAGSDSHGPDRPPIQYRADQCRALLARVGIVVD